MNKTTLALALALGTGLAAPRAHAAATSSATPTIETLNTPTISSSAFNSEFTPYNTAVLSPFRFDGATSDSGMIESQVFKGTGAMAGLYAYAYQVAVNHASDGGGEPVHVDSVSFKFNASPLNAAAAGGNAAYGYIINDGKVGGLDLPGTQTPTSLSFQPGQTTGFLRAQYVDPGTSTALNSGSNSATFVVLTNQLPSDVKPSVNVGGGSATTTVPVVYTTNPGTIEPVPVPEPATALAWAGVLGGAALVGRARKARRSA